MNSPNTNVEANQLIDTTHGLRGVLKRERREEGREGRRERGKERVGRRREREEEERE